MQKVSVRQFLLGLTGIAVALGCALSGFRLFGEAPETEKEFQEKLPLLAPLVVS